MYIYIYIYIISGPGLAVTLDKVEQIEEKLPM